MKAIGWIMVIIGVVTMGIGVAESTTAPGASIINLGLVFDRLMLVAIGGSSFVAGVVLLAAAEIRDAVDNAASLGRRCLAAAGVQLEAEGAAEAPRDHRAPTYL